MEIQDIRETQYNKFISMNSKFFLNSSKFVQPKPTLQSMRENSSSRGSMLSRSIEISLIENLPSFAEYLRMFSSSSRVEFLPGSIIVHGPLEHGRVTSFTSRRELSHSAFCRLVDSGFMESTLSKHSYFALMTREYSHEESLARYRNCVEQLGYGAELLSMIYDEQEEDLSSSQLVYMDRPCNVETSSPDKLVTYLTSNSVAEVRNIDKLHTGICPLYESNVEVPYREPIVHMNGAGVVFTRSVQTEGEAYSAVSVSLDATESRELDLSQGVVSVTATGQGSIIPAVSAYDRVKELLAPKDIKTFTANYTSYQVLGKRVLATRVMDYRAYRRQLISEAVRHKKTAKYNPRQYMFFSLYVVGRCKVQITIFSYGKESSETGPFLLYKGPIFKKGKRLIPLFEDKVEVAASPITPIRSNFVRQDPELTCHKDIYRNVIVELTTTATDLIAPLDRCISVQIVECPVHKGEQCGVAFQHKKNLNIYIPSICYNLQPNLLDYVVLWLNTRYYKNSQGDLVFRHVKNKNEDHRLFYEQECERREMILPYSILDYTKLYFIT
jgi:hypothetical protein